MNRNNKVYNALQQWYSMVFDGIQTMIFEEYKNYMSLKNIDFYSENLNHLKMIFLQFKSPQKIIEESLNYKLITKYTKLRL